PIALSYSRFHYQPLMAVGSLGLSGSPKACLQSHGAYPRTAEARAVAKRRKSFHHDLWDSDFKELLNLGIVLAIGVSFALHSAFRDTHLRKRSACKSSGRWPFVNLFYALSLPLFFCGRCCLIGSP